MVIPTIAKSANLQVLNFEKRNFFFFTNDFLKIFQKQKKNFFLADLGITNFYSILNFYNKNNELLTF